MDVWHCFWLLLLLLFLLDCKYYVQMSLEHLLCFGAQDMKLKFEYSPLPIPFSIASSHSPEKKNEAEIWVFDISVRMFIWYHRISRHQN